MSEINNDLFKSEMIAEIKKMQSELNELKNIKKDIVKKVSKRKPAAGKKVVKRKPAAGKKVVKRKPAAGKKVVKRKPAAGKTVNPKRKKIRRR